MPAPHRPLTVAVIGAGATTTYLLQNLLADDVVRPTVGRLVIFESFDRPGMGMPYNPATTDGHNICNIASMELPTLPDTLVGYLHSLDDDALADHGLGRDEIDDDEIYARTVLGRYFERQFHTLVAAFVDAGVDVEVRLNTKVQDVRDLPDEDVVEVVTDGGGGGGGGTVRADRVVISTGHRFTEQDDPDNGYFASPWPMQKLLPADGGVHNFPVGTLGASLSAFDVVASLAHRHGTFTGSGESLAFEPADDAADFKIVMHSSEGWLPQLTYAQEEPMRQVYRHVSRDQVLALRDDRGHLRLGTFWDEVCRPALIDAFEHDGRDDVAGKLRDASSSLEDFVEDMEAEHHYDDPFEGMRRELPEARRSVGRDVPIRWKEVLDDLMYALNYHADLMPAEDHRRLRKVLMPFLMNVIAAMPIKSARTLLALREAGRIELRRGYVTVTGKDDGRTTIEVDDDGDVSEDTYRLFVDCSGQGTVDLETFPFRGLVDQGVVRAAEAETLDGGTEELVGIDIDPTYRVIGTDGQPNDRVYDVAFPHTLGLRPYSYGLQACNHTAAMLVAGWREAVEDGAPDPEDAETFTELQASVPGED